MSLRVVILVIAATCCTASVIDVSDKQSAWERSGKFEGDIMLTEEQRNGMIDPGTRWPNKVVPFVIDGVFDDCARNIFMLAVSDFHNKTDIRFKEYNPQDHSDYIQITGEDTGCWSYVGRQGGRQQLNLQPNECLTKGTIIHELLHALGFYHQNSATDRDDYVTINWGNIKPDKVHDFDKYNSSTIASFGVPYDYDSIMHYGLYAFSKNGLPTIEPKDPKAHIGQRDGFSAKDMEKLAKMYEDLSSNTEENSSSITEENASSTTDENSSSTTEEISSSNTEENPPSTTEGNSSSAMEENSSSTTEEISSSNTEENPPSTTEGNSSSAMEENSSSTTEENSSYATRSHFIAFIIIILLVLTLLLYLHN